jgi:hypothetical protein
MPPQVWIVEDEKSYLGRAKTITQSVFGVLAGDQWIEWDGAPEHFPTNKGAADLVILDLNVKGGRRGFDLVKDVPGVKPFRLFGPFIVIWSHYEGDYLDEIGDLVQKLPNDRLARAGWKSDAILERLLKGFRQRILNEGVIHG